MATQSFQAQPPALPAAAERAAGGAGGGRGGGREPGGSLQPPPRRGQVKERIVKELVAAVTSMVAGLVRADKNRGGGGAPASADADEK